MKIQLTKVNHERYTLTLLRDNGSKETAESLETRSFLRHDVMHYCVEKEAKLKNSFYGSVEQGKTFKDMRPDEEEAVQESAEGSATEIVVAILQSALRDERQTTVLAAIKGALAQRGSTILQYLTEEFVDTVLKEQRLLLMKYEGTRPGETLELIF